MSALAGAALAVTACHARERAPDARATSSAAPSASHAAEPSASNARRIPPPLPAAAAPGCRVLNVKASAPLPPGTPEQGTPLSDSFGFFELSPGVELALKHGETLREFRLLGPGRFLACPGGAESVLVARGTVTTTAGPGSRAGAEVTLATPFGVVAYPDAELRLDVSDNGLTLAVKVGSATLTSDTRAGGAKPKALRGPAGRAEIHAKVSIAGLKARCEEARRHIQAANATPPPSAADARGRWAVERMEERKALRLSCAVARAAVGRLAEPERSLADNQLTGRKALEHGELDAGDGAETPAGK